VPIAIVGIGGPLYGAYKEAKLHYPEKLANLPDIPDFNTLVNDPLFSTDKVGDDLKSSLDEDNAYGFNCTKQGNENNTSQTECFNRFAKSLTGKQLNKQNTAPPMTKEEELSFFNDSKKNSPRSTKA
jgi:hypothetical protein